MSRKVRHITIPGLGRFAITPDNGDAKATFELQTLLIARHYRRGKQIDEYDLGSGLLTVTAVNTLVSDAVAGASVVPTLARFKYMDVGTSTVAATDGDSALGAAITSGPARAVAALTNNQTATTGNHLAKMQYQGTVTFGAGPTYPVAVTEWGLFDAAGSGNPLAGGNMMDHKVFAAINVNLNDSIQFNYFLSLPSNN